MLTIDGSLGEGGGQLLRTCLSLSAITGRPFQLEKIRANRRAPGLRPQHLTCVRAAAAICQAELEGDRLSSHTLVFRPGATPQGGEYAFDVADVAPGGSAGAVTLVLQAILWPLLFADRPSQANLRGGTFVPYSPSFHYSNEVARPAFAALGADFNLTLLAWGWYPAGGGEITANIRPARRLIGTDFTPHPVEQVDGIAVATNLPAHIPQRMARRAENLLHQMGIRTRVQPVRERARSAGAGIILWTTSGGGAALGRKGLPAEQVAGAAVAELSAFIDNHGAVDAHLADQLLLPMALAHGASRFSTERLTKHTLTNVALLQKWLDIEILVEGTVDGPGQLVVQGCGLSSN